MFCTFDIQIEPEMHTTSYLASKSEKVSKKDLALVLLRRRAVCQQRARALRPVEGEPPAARLPPAGLQALGVAAEHELVDHVRAVGAVGGGGETHGVWHYKK